MISKQPNLLPHIEKIVAVEGLDIIDIGAGTGRLTIPLAQTAKSVLALDQSPEMLSLIATRLDQLGLSNWETQVADHRTIPVEDNQVDLVVAGWSLCYLASSNQSEWKENLSQMIAEIKRVLRPNGYLLIFENMGTGSLQPRPPAYLTSYFEALDQSYHFNHSLIRTDYTFSDHEEALTLTNFFFEDEIVKRISSEEWVQVPEWAGMWWKQFK
nr:class I SAM-dependent methyltransferase [Polycladospora coralii]